MANNKDYYQSPNADYFHFDVVQVAALVHFLSTCAWHDDCGLDRDLGLFLG